MSETAEKPLNEAAQEPPKPLDVMVVDEWLIFDCPQCDQTIKLDRKDSVHSIECPSCSAGFEPLLDHEVKLPPKKVPARRRARRRGPKGADEGGDTVPKKARPKSRPTASSLPSEGVVKLTLTPAELTNEGKDISPAPRLPVRSALDFERRRVEATRENESKQQDESELDAVIEEKSGGKYKRIRVRTRKKRATEKQQKVRLYALAGLAAALVVGLSLWGAASMYELDGDDDDAEGSTEVYADAEPIGKEIGNRNALLKEFIDAKTVDELLKLIRIPKRLEPEIRAFYGGNELPELSVKQVNAASGRAGELPKNFHEYQMIIGSDSLPLFMEKTDTHGYRVDWESFVGLGQMAWKDFLDKRPTKTVRMRAYLSGANYYEAPFDSQTHQVLRIEDPSRKHTVYGYYRRGDSQARRLRERVFEALSHSKVPTLDNGDFEFPLIIDIRYRSGAANSAQVEIVEYITDTWLRP